MTTSAVRVSLPFHLQTLAKCGPEVIVELPGPVTADAILDAVEARYPMLCGTIRDHATKKRRPLLRYFVCQRDASHDPTDAELPTAIANGQEPFIVWGALSGG
jgi:molybdopterin synthase sulfur carrier subunit